MAETKYLLDSGDPNEYREIAALAKEQNAQLWGATTNPSLIAKQLSGKKISIAESFAKQKEIVMEIINILPGAVSAEVYADATTSAEDMIEQGREIATSHDNIIVKLPTTIAGFKARTALRLAGIPINNTLVFSQLQIFAISLHEQIIQKTSGQKSAWPSFISPFVGRLDDIGQNGMDLVTHGMTVKSLIPTELWMLAASIRTTNHVQQSITAGSELITAPAKVYREWFTLTDEQKAMLANNAPTNLAAIPPWSPSQELLSISTIETFMQALETKTLDITHPLTDKGIEKFAEDWKAIIAK